MDENEKQCPCCSGNLYQSCCGPYHQGEKVPNALALMRSRYAAYVLNLPDYIIKTTHPASPQYMNNQFAWRRGIAQFSRNSEFKNLEVFDFKENKNLATVTFTASIIQGDQDITFTERSYFEKWGDKWLYRGGQIENGHAPNLISSRPLRILPLAYYGEPILRDKAQLIHDITDDMRTLVEEMIETMEANNGMGLAAPQVHHSIQLFVYRPPVDGKGEKKELGDIKVVINPVISFPTSGTWKAPEGCLSIPGFRYEVERPQEIVIEYINLAGEKIKDTHSGWEARVILHETDHLNGVLYIDRIDEKEKERLAPLLENMKNRIHDGKDI